MGWRGLGVAVALAVVGALVGAGSARLAREEPVALDTSRPVVASSPSLPTDPPVLIKPDPLTPPLATDLPARTAKIGREPFGLTLPVPRGWTRSNPSTTEWRWFVEGNPPNTYVLKVVLPSGYRTIEQARDDRVADLDGATGIEEFELEEVAADGFVASYVLDGYRRVTIERFISVDDSQTVYAWLSVVGREADRAGMLDLLDNAVTGARR